MIKIQHNLKKLELDQVLFSNGEAYYFARTPIGAIRAFMELNKGDVKIEAWLVWHELKAVECNDEQLNNAAVAICEGNPEKHLGFDKLKKQIKGKVFTVCFE